MREGALRAPVLSSPPDRLVLPKPGLIRDLTAQLGPWPSVPFSGLKRRPPSRSAPESSCVLRGQRAFRDMAVLSKIVSGCLRSELGFDINVKKSGAKMRVSGVFSLRSNREKAPEKGAKGAKSKVPDRSAVASLLPFRSSDRPGRPCPGPGLRPLARLAPHTLEKYQTDRLGPHRRTAYCSRRAGRCPQAPDGCFLCVVPGCIWIAHSA